MLRRRAPLLPPPPSFPLLYLLLSLFPSPSFVSPSRFLFISLYFPSLPPPFFPSSLHLSLAPSPSPRLSSTSLPTLPLASPLLRLYPARDLPRSFTRKGRCGGAVYAGGTGLYGFRCKLERTAIAVSKPLAAPGSDRSRSVLSLRVGWIACTRRWTCAGVRECTRERRGAGCGSCFPFSARNCASASPSRSLVGPLFNLIILMQGAAGLVGCIFRASSREGGRREWE